jgi:hypothetical protein
MATRMNPLAGRYFNDPAFAAGASNLAAAFAPPSAEDYLAAEKYKGLKTQNSAIADLYASANGNQDILGVVGDLFDPTNGWEAMRGNLANQRYATDVGAATTLDKARIDGTFDLAGTPLTYGQGIAGLPDDVAAAIGVPAFPSQTGAGLGVPAPALSETEVRGSLLQGLSPEEQRAIMGSEVDTVQVAGPTGPTFSTPLDALGQPAYNNPGSQATPTALTYTGPDGVRRGATYQNGQFTDTTGRVLTPEEAGTVAEVGKPMGSNSELGITNSNLTDATRLEAAASTTNLIVRDIESLIDSQAGAAGLAGSLQRIGQDFVQTASEFKAALEANGVDGVVTPDMLTQLQNAGQQGPYNPVFQQVRTYLLTLAYSNARLKNGGNEVSQQALAREMEALGQGMLGNDQSLRAALSVSKQGAAIALEEARVKRGGQAGVIPTIAEVNAGTPANPADDELFRKYGIAP